MPLILVCLFASANFSSLLLVSLLESAHHTTQFGVIRKQKHIFSVFKKTLSISLMRTGSHEMSINDPGEKLVDNDSWGTGKKVRPIVLVSRSLCHRDCVEAIS